MGQRAGTSSFADFARATSDSKYIKYIVRKIVLRGFRRYAGRLVTPSGWGAIELRNWYKTPAKKILRITESPPSRINNGVVNLTTGSGRLTV